MPPGFAPLNLHGIGAVVGGAVRDDDLAPYDLQSVWLTVLYIPVFLQGVYLAPRPQCLQGEKPPPGPVLERKLSLAGLNAAYGAAWLPRIVARSALAYLKEAAIVLAVIAAAIGLSWPLVESLRSRH